jgi:hypothetical protein
VIISCRVLIYLIGRGSDLLHMVVNVAIADVRPASTLTTSRAAVDRSASVAQTGPMTEAPRHGASDLPSAFS